MKNSGFDFYFQNRRLIIVSIFFYTKSFTYDSGFLYDTISKRIKVITTFF
jgi:hypothetical protein